MPLNSKSKSGVNVAVAEHPVHIQTQNWILILAYFKFSKYLNTLLNNKKTTSGLAMLRKKKKASTAYILICVHFRPSWETFLSILKVFESETILMKIMILEHVSYTCNPVVLLALSFIPAVFLADRARSWNSEEMLSILIFAAQIFFWHAEKTPSHKCQNISSSTDFLRASEPVV